MFYIFGLIGIVWSILMMILNSDSPTNHKFISAAEKYYIMESIDGVKTNYNIKKYAYVRKLKFDKYLYVFKLLTHQK